MTADDWPVVRQIYEEGIATGQATFETAAPDWDQWDRSHRPDGRLVAELAGTVVGWVALVPVSPRAVYSGVAEVMVYVAATARGQGVGRALLSGLIESAAESGIWTLQAVMFPENEASIRLHERCGFRVVGRRERLGRMGETWRDVLLMERRA
jgi:phosphinothricin acetyltransferase